ncbi:MAG: NPCBM/NEW2 domain-containing protein [Armatimonadota bacterium]
MSMNTIFTMSIIVLIASMATADSTDPMPGEMLTAHKWTLAAFEGVQSHETLKLGLEVVTDWDRVQRNSRYGLPLTIGTIRHARGIHCHAPSKIIVHLPSPGKEFTATAGLDDGIQHDVRDWQSGPLWPEVLFSVKVDDKEAFKSAVVGIWAPIPVTADLGGAKDFTLEVNGKSFNDWAEADWVDAKVTLQDGSILYLDQLSMLGQMAEITTDLPPFSFTYGNKKSVQLLPGWKSERSSRKLDADRTERTLTFSDPDTGLLVRCVSVEYHDFPSVEWTVYFKNTGHSDTPILKDIRGLDMKMQRGPGSEFLLHHSFGGSCRADDYRPLETSLTPAMKKTFAPMTGFSSDVDMPYFNVESGSGEGVVVAIGWPGQWSADFIRDEESGLHITAGQQTTRLKLHPGEEIRTPLTVLQFWQGDYLRSQNIWRRWFIAHNMPRPGGKAIKPIMPATLYGMQFAQPPVKMSEVNQKEAIDTYANAGVKIDWWWIDAGWHEGTWQPIKERFPKGLLPVTDYARSKGLHTVVWFAPEQAPSGGKPEWLLSAKGTEPLNKGLDVLNFDFSNSEAWQWMVDMIDSRITENGIDCFRLDGGWGILPNLQKNDKKDRQGITENHYMTRFLAFYDELLRRHPDLMIDNCCRGGRRNDIETLRRSVPLWRTDYLATAASQQCQTYGISLWIPFNGIENTGLNSYEFRSRMTPSTNLNHYVHMNNEDLKFLSRMSTQWHEICDSYMGDYYPLTPYTALEGEWMAWQYDTPETGKGFVQVFRRAGDPLTTVVPDVLSFRLKGLDPSAKYSLKDMDSEEARELTGQSLMEKGIQLQTPDKPTAWVFAYKKIL